MIMCRLITVLKIVMTVTVLICSCTQATGNSAHRDDHDHNIIKYNRSDTVVLHLDAEGIHRNCSSPVVKLRYHIISNSTGTYNLVEHKRFNQSSKPMMGSHPTHNYSKYGFQMLEFHLNRTVSDLMLSVKFIGLMETANRKQFEILAYCDMSTIAKEIIYYLQFVLAEDRTTLSPTKPLSPTRTGNETKATNFSLYSIRPSLENRTTLSPRNPSGGTDDTGMIVAISVVAFVVFGIIAISAIWCIFKKYKNDKERRRDEEEGINLDLNAGAE